MQLKVVIRFGDKVSLKNKKQKTKTCSVHATVEQEIQMLKELNLNVNMYVRNVCFGSACIWRKSTWSIAADANQTS